MVHSLIAGASAGALAKTVIAPLDRTKINFQIENKPFNFSEALRFLIRTYKEHGFTHLWRGNSATMARIIPYAAIQYCAHEQFKRLLQVETNEQKYVNFINQWYLDSYSLFFFILNRFRKKHLERSFIAGSMAGVVSTSVTYPLDLARARMAVTNESKYKNLSAVFRKIIQTEGYIKLYKGYMPTILGVIPYAGTSFFTYETLKRLHYGKYFNDSSFIVFNIFFFFFLKSFSYRILARFSWDTSDFTFNIWCNGRSSRSISILSIRYRTKKNAD